MILRSNRSPRNGIWMSGFADLDNQDNALFTSLSKDLLCKNISVTDTFQGFEYVSKQNQTQFVDHIYSQWSIATIAEKAPLAFQLGVCSRRGWGCPLNLKQGAYWFRSAATQGHAKAQNHLGICFHSGEGVEQDFKQAVHWFRLAAAQGVAFAMSNIGRCYYLGEGVVQDCKQALHWYKLSAAAGDVGSLFIIGSIYVYVNGKGMTPNWKLAVHWFELAAIQKFEGVQESLVALLKTKDEQRALYWMLKFPTFPSSDINEFKEIVQRLTTHVDRSPSAKARKAQVLGELSIWVHPVQHLVWGYIKRLPTRIEINGHRPPVAQACTECVDGWFCSKDNEGICGTCQFTTHYTFA